MALIAPDAFFSQFQLFIPFYLDILIKFTGFQKGNSINNRLNKSTEDIFDVKFFLSKINWIEIEIGIPKK